MHDEDGATPPSPAASTATPADLSPAPTPASASTETRSAFFGDEIVPLSEKPERVRGVFSNVAARYDLMNDLMSARVHRLWKDAMMDWLAPRPSTRLVDLAGGTGDIALRYLERVGGAGEAVVIDLTEAMVREGRRRVADRSPTAPISWVCGDATALPLPDRSADYVTIAFGIRNVAEPERALAEARRVLKIGGRFLCLEFSRVRVPGLDALYAVYSDRVIPFMGRIVAGDAASYRYLVESIRRFPDQERFAEMIETAGFSRVAHRNLTGGVAALHSGWRL